MCLSLSPVAYLPLSLLGHAPSELRQKKGKGERRGRGRERWKGIAPLPLSEILNTPLTVTIKANWLDLTGILYSVRQVFLTSVPCMTELQYVCVCVCECVFVSFEPKLNTLLLVGSGRSCFFQRDLGTCHNWTPNFWYYDGNLKRCESFTYSGCGGNSNLFGSEKKCMDACGSIRREDLWYPPRNKSEIFYRAMHFSAYARS